MLRFVLEAGLCFDGVISKLYTKRYIHALARAEFLTARETQYTKDAHMKKQGSTIWSELTWTVKVTISPSGQTQNCNRVAYF
jgi:hypothetical protein